MQACGVERPQYWRVLRLPATCAARRDAFVAPDRFSRRLLPCGPDDQRSSFVDADSGAGVADIRTRSFDDMICFRGEARRGGTEDKPVVVDGVVLFQTGSRRGARHLPCGPMDVTGHVLSLLNRRYLLAQSDEFLAPPEARVR